jgi:hypothetical protein
MMDTTNTSPEMVLNVEKAKPNSIAFKVININESSPGSAAGKPIKKRLEAYNSPSDENLSREAIEEKLKRAEEKRRQTLLIRGGAVSPRIAEERRRLAKERKRALDEGQLNNLKKRTTVDINMAEEKRKQSEEELLQRLRKHNEIVNERCREQAEKRQSSTEKMKTEIEKKLEQASINREEHLDKVKNVAHHSAEKKKPGAGYSASGLPPCAYDSIPLPTFTLKKD